MSKFLASGGDLPTSHSSRENFKTQNTKFRTPNLEQFHKLVFRIKRSPIPGFTICQLSKNLLHDESYTIAMVLNKIDSIIWMVSIINIHILHLRKARTWVPDPCSNHVSNEPKISNTKQ